MVRKLKTHEQKLLKKTDFMSWQVDQQGRQGEMLRKFHVTKREHYSLYNTLAAKSRELADLIKNLPESDPFRSKCTEDVLSKFYNAGLVPTADTLERIGKVTGASFARRRLPVVMRNTGMVDSVKTASDLVEQGHVRIGTKIVTDHSW
ncbi:hypothetical protein CAEBREN_06056 [Caenorhabditis brenneri]|uniref:Small ribosomal subunit protein uS4 N-terminal domain-containing protein n=1 Tax=Caenorhabditis brenneri TaxID=135651 RepID=G0P0B4_CAEBE|nr:hypothetical protein CAEBREN_06056 [Caenorhabditis brenneri]